MRNAEHIMRNAKHKMESRLPGEISITSDMQITLMTDSYDTYDRN